MAKLYFYYAAMNAGKSTMLLQANHNYEERGMETLLLLPAKDDRKGRGVVYSRLGVFAEAVIVPDALDLLHYVQDYINSGHHLKCVLVDEAQFLSKEQVLGLAEVVDDLGVPVLCYGLRTDFKGELFEGSHWLLALADSLIEIKTMCHCGRKAIMNMRINPAGEKVETGEQVLIGGNELYTSVCRKHYALGESGVKNDEL